MIRCPSCDDAGVGEDFICTACGWKADVIDDTPCLAPELAVENTGFDDAIFDAFVAAKDTHFMLWYRNRLIIEAIQKHFPKFERMLEAGAGSGMVLSALLDAFPACRIDASEIFLSGIAMLRRVVGDRPGCLFQMDGTRMPFADHYDIIGMFDVIEHIDDDALVIDNVFNALKPGGGFILTVPQHPSLWSAADDAVSHKRRYRPGELAARLRDGGFEIVRDTSYNLFLVPAMMLSRALQRGEYDPKREWKLHPFVNGVLLTIVKLEKMLIDTGLHLPAGGSGLVVARKPVQA